MVRLLLQHDEAGLAEVYTDKQYNVCQYEYMNGKVIKKTSAFCLYCATLKYVKRSGGQTEVRQEWHARLPK